MPTPPVPSPDIANPPHAEPPAGKTQPPAPIASNGSPVKQVKDHAFDDSVAGEEDPGAGVDALTPRPKG